MSDVVDQYSVTADELRSFIERMEQLDSEKKDLAEQQIFKVVLRQNYEVIDGETRGWRDLVSLEEVKS